MNLDLHADTFKAKLSQPQLWILRLAADGGRLDTTELRAHDRGGAFSRAVISYSIKALAKRGLLRTQNEERKISRVQITAAGRKLLKTIPY
jgi:DNA-binding MarR family transcriptional regulator